MLTRTCTRAAHAIEPPPSAALPSPFVCDRARLAPENALSRLSGTQYRSRLRELIAFAAPDHSAAILSELAPVLAALPRDLRSDPWQPQ